MINLILLITLAQSLCLKARLLHRLLRLAEEHPACALHALSGLGPAQLQKLLLFGGLPTIVNGLVSAPDSSVTLLSNMTIHCSQSLIPELVAQPAMVTALATCLGDGKRADPPFQACIAHLLADLAGKIASSEKNDHAVTTSSSCLHALEDEALPRACELLREEPPALPRLSAACALLAARLLPISRTACRLVTQHMKALEPVVAALVKAHKYKEAQEVLRAAGEFAREP